MSPSVKSSLSLDLVDPTLKPTGSTTTTTSTGLRPNTLFLDVASNPSSSKILTLTGSALKHKQGTTSTTTTTTKKPVRFPDQVFKETYFLSFPNEHNYEHLKITYQYLTLLSQQKILSKGITINWELQTNPRISCSKLYKDCSKQPCKCLITTFFPHVSIYPGKYIIRNHMGLVMKASLFL